MLQRGADVDATSVQGLPEESVHRTVLKGSTDWSFNKGTIDIDDMYADGIDERCVDGIRKQHIASRGRLQRPGAHPVLAPFMLADMHSKRCVSFVLSTDTQ